MAIESEDVRDELLWAMAENRHKAYYHDAADIELSPGPQGWGNGCLCWPDAVMMLAAIEHLIKEAP